MMPTITITTESITDITGRLIKFLISILFQLSVLTDLFSVPLYSLAGKDKK